MNILEKWPAASWHIVPRKDGALSDIYCGGSPVALCVPDELSPMLKAAPAMLAALNAAYNVLTNSSKTTHEKFCEATTLLENAIDRAEGR